MLKSVLYALLMITTSVRLIDIIYLLIKQDTNLPVPVIIVSSVMIIYGLILLAKRIIGNVTLKQLMAFYMLQTIMIGFNLVYVAVASPLRVSAAETLIVGTFFDILVNCCVVYLCTKQLRRHYFAVAQPAVPSHRHV